MSLVTSAAQHLISDARYWRTTDIWVKFMRTFKESMLSEVEYPFGVGGGRGALSWRFTDTGNLGLYKLHNPQFVLGKSTTQGEEHSGFSIPHVQNSHFGAVGDGAIAIRCPNE